MSRSRQAAVLYAAVGAVHVAGAAVHHDLVDNLTKPLLMPLLAVYAVAAHAERGGRIPRRLLLSLALAWAGDVTLQLGGTVALVVGMVFFALAYGVYAVELTRTGAFRRRRRWLYLAGYGAAATAALAWLWPGLSERGVAWPMAGYAALMAVMASAATSWGWRVGLGGGLLLASDTLIGVGLAEAADVPGRAALVMATYLLGQALVVAGWAARTPRPEAVAPAPRPADLVPA
ncbi:lysoplasmalogenase family protein [Phytohabitans sp. ZYX-F-186]|uniref:Lysoplasmalogenase family protein n=1 Tax=Phytohabitans maris TaxID=3071409 RepID=A0ABU0ZDQ3_9ACTN|nr:lysoplasmalogenase family protein [Phytohabitans sp. ZYX-F-186]MDQ7904487.1 lysoplasmalogenase family protein [Phytohabitans sp. ZYX-F-186]